MWTTTVTHLGTTNNDNEKGKGHTHIIIFPLSHSIWGQK